MESTSATTEKEIQPVEDVHVENENSNKPSAEEQCLWLPQILESDPYLLDLREKALPFTGGLSFSSMVHTALTSSPSVFNRYAVLELVYNHLVSIGMYQTAEILRAETGLEFQNIDEPMERTGLRVLTSLGILPHENMWNVTRKSDCVFLDEVLEEDFFSSSHREDPRKVYIDILNNKYNVEYDSSEHTFKHITACSLNRLIAIITTNDTSSRNNEMNFKNDDLHMLFLTLHSITSGEHFLKHLIAVFELDFDDDQAKTDIIARYPRIRFNAANIILKWVKFHGLFIGKKTIKLIDKFSNDIISKNKEDEEDPMWEDYVKVFIEIRNILPHLSYGQALPKPTITELPIIKDSQAILSPTLELLNQEVVTTAEREGSKEKDPDPREIARQITLLSYKAFSEIHSREFMQAIVNKSVTIQTPSLSKFFNISDKIERVTLEAIANAPKPIDAVKEVCIIAEELDNLGNYDALSRVIAALSIPELSKVITKAKIDKKIQRMFGHIGTNESTLDWYRQNLETRFENNQPTVPNITSEIVFAPVIDGPCFNPNGLINWEKRKKVGRIMTTFYKFQNCPYCFWPVPQIQKLITRGGTLTDRQLGQKITKKIK